MTVGDLKALLEEYDEDMLVRIAFQPSWPLRAEIRSVRAESELPNDDDYDGAQSADDTLWIAVDQVSAHSESPYAPREAWAC